MRNVRNSFEDSIAEQIEYAVGCAAYECESIEYVSRKGERKQYYPDFVLPNGLRVEAKGLFRPEDRSKHKCIKKQHPELEVRIVFQNATTRINRKSNTTYEQWCKRHGIRCAHNTIPASWFQEPHRQ